MGNGKRACITGISAILLQVRDLKRSLKFYRAGLGIRFDPKHGDATCAYARVGKTGFLLHVDYDPSLKKAHRGAGIAVHFSVKDVDAYWKVLKGRGVKLRGKPANHPWGREFSVVDPDGYEIEILGPLPRGAKAEAYSEEGC